ncbi:MAG: hypothetical protein QM647_13060, partial [Asticcacaulis sp.]|uniref:hypothetical protein n=1 Tax=Asticcacaulis sp. TaxID=1872648 RepID=UPI0039E668BE
RETSAPRIETRETSAPRIETWGASAPSIVTWGASAPSIETRETSAPRIETRETSAPRIETWGASAPSIVTWGASAPSIEAFGYSMLRVTARMSISFNAGPNVAVHYEGDVTVTGGHSVEIKKETPQDWCDYYGARVVDGVAILYKAVDAQFKSHWGGDYTPGLTPSVDKFRAEPECGPGALYFSPTPRHTHQFVTNPEKYVACPVRLEDIVTHPTGSYPAKVKAKGCCAPVYECDIWGDPVKTTEAVA